MRVLVVGSGGREHTLVWKILQSPKVDKVYCAPGNAGIKEIAECVKISVDDIEGLKEFALKNKIDLTVVGPEKPLVNGIVDVFNSAGLKIFGPEKMAAQLEGSKKFAKELMEEKNVSTGKYKTFHDKDKCMRYLKGLNPPYVLKADGLAAGKGVVIAADTVEAEKALDDMLVNKIFGEAGSTVVVEEFLDGPEVSILAFCDGENVLPMVSAQDHKKAYDGNKGPNTGGMGAFSPSPLYNNELHLEVIEKILKPVVRGLKDKGISYKGILYAGLILTKEGPKVLEFNCRFGDPETQAVLKRLDSDLVDVMLAAVDGKLEKVALKWSDEPAVCVVLASGGYPGSYEKGKVISGLEEVGKLADIFHAGTAFNEKEEIITAGGRVLGVTSKGRNLEEASDNAYKAVDIIEFEDMQFRKDIGRSLD
jgi:phosphoribosylamine--glycine ligase